VRSGSTPYISGVSTEWSLSFFGRIAYAGAGDFALGVDLSYDLVPIRGMEDRQGFMSAVVDIRLFF
jgi:hypothetical protein